MWITRVRTVLFYMASVPFTMTWAAFFGLFAYLIPYPARYHVVIGGWARMMHVFTVIFLGIRVRVHGRENIPDEACVIISNHQSAWETYYMQHLFKPQSQVTKASLLKIPVFGWTFAMLKPIAINRSNKRQAMNQVVEQGSMRISEGNSVLIFPEGTRTDPEHPLPFRKGGAVLAKAAGCKMVPVTHNSGQFWLNDRFEKVTGTIDVYIHPPIETHTREAGELMAEAEQVILAKLEQIGAQPTPDHSVDEETEVTA